jgi:hypothetical protein
MPARVVLERRRIGGAADLLPQRQLLVEPPPLLRLRRLHRPARRDEVEVVLERGALPRDLRTVRLAPHAEADPLEHVLDLGFPDRDLAQQVLGVEAVRPGSIARHVAGRGRVREQRVAGGVHLRQALLIDALEVAERIVAAGVQDDHVHRGARPAQPLQQAVDLDALPLNVRDRLDLRVDRQHVVAPRELDAVPGVVEQADALALRHLRHVRLHGGGHRGPPESVFSVTAKPRAPRAPPTALASFTGLRSGASLYRPLPTTSATLGRFGGRLGNDDDWGRPRRGSARTAPAIRLRCSRRRRVQSMRRVPLTLS